MTARGRASESRSGEEKGSRNESGDWRESRMARRKSPNVNKETSRPVTGLARAWVRAEDRMSLAVSSRDRQTMGCWIKGRGSATSFAGRGLARESNIKHRMASIREVERLLGMDRVLAPESKPDLLWYRHWVPYG